MDIYDKSLIVVSNRLPVAIYKEEDDQWRVKPSTGGLVTALAPIISKTKGMWIGWPGCPADAPAEELLREYNQQVDYRMVPILINQDEINKFYLGFSNNTIWPLFHDLLGHFSFNYEEWNTYIDVNRRFAELIAEVAKPDSLIWVHDYQLLLVGHFLRELNVKNYLNFFLHIPFPSYDLYRRLPWKQELIQAILDYDHIGFQTPSDRRNFIQCIKWLTPDAVRTVKKRQSFIHYNKHTSKLGYYPISIDFDEFNEGTKAREVADAAWYLHENLNSKTFVLGLDRLDYTKGIPNRFLAFERMLEKYPDTVGNISLIQVVIPSRTKVLDYQILKSELDTLAGRINGRFSNHGWIPIHYQFREMDRTQLLGHYYACEIALVTPLRDGMNLVAKEYCASSIDNNGVLILSEFAGAAAQLSKGALMVNPYDLESTADAIYAAFIMNPEEKQRRMKILRNEVKRNDVKRWVKWFLSPGKDPVGPAEHLSENIKT